jgi:anti-anti-sigma factor
VGALEATVAAGESGPVIVLTGESDLMSAGQLSELLSRQLSTGAQNLTLDVSGLTFADSASVRALVLAARTLRERGGSMVLIRPQPAVARVLELMGVTELVILQAAAEQAQRRA